MAPQADKILKLIVDVRTREEYIKNHIKGAINIPLYDLEFYTDFLKDKEIFLYCDSGKRSKAAAEKLRDKGINAKVLFSEGLKNYEWERKSIVCAVNYVEVKPGLEELFEQAAKELCSKTIRMEGFLGSKIFKISGMSCIGSGLPGDCTEIEFKPTKYILMTFWESKEAHEKSHKHPIFVEAFKEIPQYLAKMPYEEFYEIIK